MTRKYERWTKEQDAELLRLYEVEGKFFKDIETIMNKGRHSAGDRYKILMRERGDLPAKAPKTTARMLLRDAIRVHETERVTAGHTSITAMMFGDPPPGRSALDEKRAAQL